MSAEGIHHLYLVDVTKIILILTNQRNLQFALKNYKSNTKSHNICNTILVFYGCTSDKIHWE